MQNASLTDSYSNQHITHQPILSIFRRILTFNLQTCLVTMQVWLLSSEYLNKRHY